MLVIKNMEIKKATGEGQWFERELWGGTLRLKIRPRTDNVINHIRDEFKRMREGPKKEAVILDAVYDYLVETFDPVSEELPDGEIKEMDVTLENKKKILFMQVPAGEESMVVWLINKATGLSFDIREEEIKN